MLMFRMLKNGFKHISVFNENHRVCQFFTSVHHRELTCLGISYHSVASLAELDKWTQLTLWELETTFVYGWVHPSVSVLCIPTAMTNYLLFCVYNIYVCIPMIPVHGNWTECVMKYYDCLWLHLWLHLQIFTLSLRVYMTCCL